MHISQTALTSALCLLPITGMTATAAAEDKMHKISQVQHLDKKWIKNRWPGPV